MDTEEKIVVMQAYLDGKTIEAYNLLTGENYSITPNPTWNWIRCDYRVKEEPDSINWDHVHPDYKYMARDANGDMSLFKTKPFALNTFWMGIPCTSLGMQGLFVSYKRGIVDWKDSLVVRPGVRDVSKT